MYMLSKGYNECPLVLLLQQICVPTACSMSLSAGGRDPLFSDLCHHHLTAVVLWLAVTWLYILYWGVPSRLKRAKSLQPKPGLQTLAFSVVQWNSSCQLCTANGDPGLGRKLVPAKMLSPACVTVKLCWCLCSKSPPISRPKLAMTP